MDDLQRSLERYDVLDRIAVGGMAEVFLAKAYGAHGFEKTLAIKRILPELARDPEFEARFIAEAKVAVRLSHANVVQVFDFGRFGESLFIAMEFVDGMDLAALLRKYRDLGRQIPLPAAFHIAIEIMRGLDFAHQHSVVHRDVSPSNILLSRAGEVKIADFGIAVAARPHKGGGPGPRKVMGKWRYMSPEQARGDTLDTRSDLFSAASVMFELFTGDKLFPGDEAEDIIRNIETMPLPKVSSLRPGLPARLDEILISLLARRPSERPPRPAQVLRSLIELSYESSIVATALDVAETVGAVLPPARPSTRGGLDDVIRKQLSDQEPSQARQTAVTDGKPAGTQTLARERADDAEAARASLDDKSETSGLWLHKVGMDGLSRLEADAGAFEAPLDPDRRTEVGAPPTGPVTKFELAELERVAARPAEAPAATGLTAPAAADREVTPPTATERATSPARRLRTGLLIGVPAALAGAAVVALLLARGGNDPGPAPPPPRVPLAIAIDAAPATTGTLIIDSDPAGARGEVAGVAFGPTPAQVTVPLGRHRVTLDLAGYATYVDDGVEVTASAPIRLRAVLTAAPAALHVVTEPAGALVTVAGRILGETPLTRSDLAAGAGVTISLSRAGFAVQTFKIELVAGQRTEVNRELKAAPRFGLINLYIEGGWAEVYFKGAKIGRAPLKDLKLPVGHQQLRLVNPPSGKEWTLEVDVDEREVRRFATPLGG
jgi:serine/threonine protein kinase